MSIIHDALKKVQEGRNPKPNTTPAQGAGAPEQTGSDYVYSNSPEKQSEEKPVEHLHYKRNMAKSILAFICALAISGGAFWFLYKQVGTYFPGFKGWAMTSINKLMNKKTLPSFKTRAVEDLKPLAKITLTPPNPSAAASQVTSPASPSVNTAGATISQDISAPITLNIHGVMSNGPTNLALINDQVYQEGDEIDGIKIAKINLKSITVIDNGKEKTIPVKN